MQIDSRKGQNNQKETYLNFSNSLTQSFDSFQQATTILLSKKVEKIKLLYSLIINQLAAIFITFILVYRNYYSEEIFHFFTFLAILLFSIFGCTLYQLKLIFDAEQRFKNNSQEYELNQKIYECTIKFVYFFTNQKSFTTIKMIYIYNSIAILLLLQKFCMIYQQDNLQNQKNIGISHLILQMIDYPLLSALYILSSIIAFTFIFFEILKLIYFFILVYNDSSNFNDQYRNSNLKTSNTIAKAKKFCLLSIFYYLNKLVFLFMMINSTPNYTSQILIGSNIFYHLLMVLFELFLFSQIFNIDSTIRDTQTPIQNNIYFDDHVIFINSLLRIKNLRNKLFQFFLVISVIFTIHGCIIFNSSRINGIYSSFLYNTFIWFDCGIFQLIILVNLIFKFIIIQFFQNQSFKDYFENQVYVLQDQQFISTDQQSIQISHLQSPISINLIENNCRIKEENKNRNDINQFPQRILEIIQFTVGTCKIQLLIVQFVQNKLLMVKTLQFNQNVIVHIFSMKNAQKIGQNKIISVHFVTQYFQYNENMISYKFYRIFIILIITQLNFSI
ncbi:unnamed protein product [Paramecium sonneborni]|uniref:Transmembrane protein n=1 Tax=Paramecium sonneborni TaxID=65129 RepID=A0A8S1MN67_9CILI|nr:unnamed protein product [Paramecium sonneborni]